jgi:hypothetical protein
VEVLVSLQALYIQNCQQVDGNGNFCSFIVEGLWMMVLLKLHIIVQNIFLIDTKESELLFFIGRFFSGITPVE